MSRILESLSDGSLISMQYVSSMIPKKDKDIDGPCSLSVVRGTPKPLHSDVNMSTLFWQTWDSDGPTFR